MSRLILIILLLTTPALPACGGTMNLGVPSPTVTRAKYSPGHIYRAAKLSLGELGIVQEASVDRGLIEGQIPPFQVKAVMKHGAPSIRLQGIGLNRGEWQRDSIKKRWLLMQDGKEHHRNGVKSLAEAVQAWQRAIEKRLP